MPTSQSEKLILEEAGLWEKTVCIPDLDCDRDAFRSVILATYPKLRDGGGFELLRCQPNSRELVVIGPKIANSPRLLKRRVGNGRVYVRPIQRNLSLEEEKGEVDVSQSVSCALLWLPQWSCGWGEGLKGFAVTCPTHHMQCAEPSLALDFPFAAGDRELFGLWQSLRCECSEGPHESMSWWLFWELQKQEQQPHDCQEVQEWQSHCEEVQPKQEWKPHSAHNEDVMVCFLSAITC